MNKEYRGELDNKKKAQLEDDLNDAFDKIWKEYLNLERQIWELSAIYEHYPDEAYMSAICNLCTIAVNQINSIRILANVLYDGAMYENFSSSCEEKKSELLEISRKIRMGKTSSK